MYGYQNVEDVAQGNSGGKFGLNIGAFVTKFEYNPNGGKDGAEADCIDFTVKIEEKEYRSRFFPITKVFKKGGGEITDTNSKEYKEQQAKDIKMFNATISDIVTCFITDAELREALSAPIQNFKDFATIVERLVKTTPNWDKKPVDVFLQYQWKPQRENTRTFLELPKPKNIIHGTFIVSSKGQGYVSDGSDSHLKYVNEGDIHPFKRTTWFVNSPFANVTIVEDDSDVLEGNVSSTDW